MSEIYPINNFGPVMQGMAIGGLGILHVFLAQFAIGGGMLMCYLQWRSMHTGSLAAKMFLDGFFKFLVLVSFVLGAVTGVAMWFMSIQVGPRTIGLMVDAFHWVWAIEWTFFCLEVIAGYAFYRYGKWLDDRTRLTLLAIYTLAAWMSLFWINGILSWQLTPGQWIETRSVWAGFFNPGFWPSLLFRTISSLTIAALVAMVVINLLPHATRRQRHQLIHEVCVLLVPMLAMPVLGTWYIGTMPADSRGWVLGGSPTMNMFLIIAVGASTLIGLYALLGLVWGRLYVNAATALILVCLAFGATAGGEFVREGVRKPFTIREVLYSNGIRADEVPILRQQGLLNQPGMYPLRNPERYANEQIRAGAIVYRQLCSVCHTLNGVNALDELTGTWTIEQKRLNIAQLQRTKAFMPPFAGNAEEVEALVQFLAWRRQRTPANWPTIAEQVGHEQALAQINQYLRQVGCYPADPEQRLQDMLDHAQGKSRQAPQPPPASE